MRREIGGKWAKSIEQTSAAQTSSLLAATTVKPAEGKARWPGNGTTRDRHQTATAGIPKGARSWRAAQRTIGRARPMGANASGRPGSSASFGARESRGPPHCGLLARGGHGAVGSGPVNPARGRSPQENRRPRASGEGVAQAPACEAGEAEARGRPPPSSTFGRLQTNSEKP